MYPLTKTCVRGWVSTTVPRVSAMFKFPDSSYFVLWNEERSSLWWRNGYRNWDDTGFKKRPQTQNLPFACIDWPMDVRTYSTVGDLFDVAESTASVIFNQEWKVLVSTLYERCANLPRNRAEWKHELESLLENWEFPCVGAWEGFHVYVSTKLKNYFSF